MDYDVAILGSGIAPCLAGVALYEVAPCLQPVLLTRDRAIGGESLELVPLARLPKTIAALCESALVKEWDGWLVVRDGERHFVEEPVGLVQPAQLWLEIDERLGGVSVVTSCGDLRIEEPRIAWRGGHVVVDDLVDLRDLTAPRRSNEIVDADFLAALKYPVLADFDVNGQESPYLQYIPLGSGLTMLTRVYMADGAGRVTPGASPDIDGLPTIAHFARVSAACSRILCGEWRTWSLTPGGDVSTRDALNGAERQLVPPR